MKGEFWAQVENAYLEAAELPGEQRTPFLEKVYRDRPDIRREVESLLEHKEAAQHLTQSSIVVSAARLFDDDDDLIGTIVGGKYRVRECIGSGGQSDVYLADHIALDSSFALKRAAPVLRNDPEFRQRFLEEARRAVVLRHDNVARVHDVLESGGEMFVVMEHIEGETLRQRLERLHRPLTVEEFLPIALQCAAALAAAHEKRIVHLDVKPENIMLTTDERVKICDFGIARRLSAKSNTETSDALTPDWRFAGTPAYMAPEVILSYQFDERADLFSLGTVFYEMLTGRNPFLAATGPATTARVVSEQPAPIQPHVDAKLERVIARLLDKDPTKRLANAGELLKQLEAFRRSESRFADLRDSVRGAFAEHWWFKAATIAFLIAALSLPVIWINRDRIGDKLSGTTLPNKKIVAVLPFRVIGDNTVDRFFSEGFSELLNGKLTRLTTLPDLQVVPAFEIREKDVDTTEKARSEFGATIAVAGTFQFLNGEARVSYSIVDTVGNQTIRSGEKTVNVADPFTLQDLIVRDVVAMLEIELSESSRETLQVFGTRNTKAFFLLAEARGALQNAYELKNLDTAINLFNEALAIDPNYTAAYAGLGEAYRQKFTSTDDQIWTDRAKVACENAVNSDQRSSEAHTCLGQVNESKGYYEEAVENFKRAIDYDATNDTAYRRLGLSLELLNRFDQAQQVYEQAISLRKQYWAGYQWLADFYNRRHDYQQAIPNYQTAIALSPDNRIAYFALGGAYTNNGEYEKAIPALQKSLQIRPAWEAYSNLGMTYVQMRRYKDAIDPLEKAAADGEHYNVTGNLARIYWLTGQTDKARTAYENGISQGKKLLALNPRNHAVHILLGRYYAMLGQKAEAVSHINIALNAHPGDPHYLMIAAISYLQLGDRGNCLGLLDQSIALGSTTRDVRAEPELDVLETDPRFVALTKKLEVKRR